MGKEKLREIPIIEKTRLKNQYYFYYKKVHEAIPAWLYKYMFKGGERAHECKPDPSGITARCLWMGWRDVTDYIAFKAEVELDVRQMNTVVVEEDGKKIKKNTGKCEVTISATMVKDYKEYFKRKGRLGEFFRQLYDRYVIGEDKLEEYEDKLYFEMLDLIEIVKEALNA